MTMDPMIYKSQMQPQRAIRSLSSQALASPVTKSINRANRKTKVKNVLSSKWGQEIVKQTLAQACYNYQYLFYSQMK